MIFPQATKKAFANPSASYANIPSLTTSFKEGRLCMLGGVYSDQRCPMCGGSFKDDGKRGLFCPEHPQCQATKFRVIFKGVHLRCSSYEEASQTLSGMRFKFREGSFDDRDYRKDQPLGFANLADQFLIYKATVEKKRSTQKMAYHLNYAKSLFQNRNIKDIGEGELQDLLAFLPPHLSDKTKKNIFTTLHSLWAWVQKRERKKNPFFIIPEFPSIQYQLKWRRIVDKPTQWQILQEIERIAPNPKIYLACLWLATYPNVRPGELISVKEKDFDLLNGTLEINFNKENKPKKIYLLPEDVEMVKSFPRSFPELYFFRKKTGKTFGGKLLWRWWKRACDNLGIEGVPLYPGTKHSTATDLKRSLGAARAREATGHSTNKAFERYIVGDPEDLRALYAYARPGKELAKDFCPSEKSNLLKFK